MIILVTKMLIFWNTDGGERGSGTSRDVPEAWVLVEALAWGPMKPPWDPLGTAIGLPRVP